VDVSDAARCTLEETGFVAAWRTLYDGCSWATAGEHPGLLVPWYRHYGAEHEPVLVYQREVSGALGGLLALCRSPDGERLLPAGYVDAEYHVWLADATRADTFMPTALAALRGRLGPVRVEFGYLPPNAPLGWLKRRHGAVSCCELIADERMIVRTDDTAAIERYVRSKKRLRSRLSSLKRLGEVCFRRVLDRADLERVLDQFIPLIDFRKGAMYGLTPFRVDPHKRAFLLDQFETPGLLHVTVLELDGRVIAAHLGTAGKGELPLSSVAHSDFYAEISPGQQLLLELIRRCPEDGIGVFDLTPGADAYKNRFGVESQGVHTLIVHPHRWHYIAARARGGLKRLARERLSAKTRGRVRELRDRRWDHRAVAASKPAMTRVYVLSDAVLKTATRTMVVSRNSVADLVALSTSDESRYLAFLRGAYAYVRAGAQTYTCMHDGALAGAWFVLPGRGDPAARAAGVPEDAWVLRGVAEGPAMGAQSGLLPAVLAEFGDQVRGALYAVAHTAEEAAIFEEAGLRAVR
jgi:hypothetical protein